MKFTKMHGLGNDFIILDEREKQLDIDMTQLVPKICDRHMGIGADGVVRVLPSEHSDYKMEIINADGSVPEMCGNGIRCFAKYVFEHSPNHKEVFSVDTGAGVIIPAIEIQNKKVVAVEVDMGEPILDPAKMVVTGIKESMVLNQKMTVAGKEYIFSAVSMGNPHVIIFTEDPALIDIAKIGPQIENHEMFPNRTNVHFVKIDSKTEITVRHWERGAGETLACGTGACACVVAGVLDKKLERKVLVHVPGGDMSVDWNSENNHVLMTGPAANVYQGELNI